VYLHDLANAIDASHRCYIAQKIEIKFLVKSGIDRVVGPDHEQRITVRRRTSAAILPPAPGRFSMTNRCPRRSDSHWPMRRASTSMAWPAANPTNGCTGRTGYACAHARGGQHWTMRQNWLPTVGTFGAALSCSFLRSPRWRTSTGRARAIERCVARTHFTPGRSTTLAARGDEETVR
jgi:hypothetical protein